MLQLLDELGQRLVEADRLVLVDFDVEIVVELLFTNVILLLETLHGHVTLLDLLSELRYGLLVSLPSSFLSSSEVVVLVLESLDFLVHLGPLDLGLVSRLDGPGDLLRHPWHESRLPRQLRCLLHQLLRPLDVANIAVCAQVDGLAHLDADVVQVGAEFILGPPLGLKVLLGPPNGRQLLVELHLYFFLLLDGLYGLFFLRL